MDIGLDVATAIEPDPGSVGPTEIVLVDIAALDLDGSPRLAGEDAAHTQRLAEGDAELPPILVQRRTMRVLDGMHRVEAARLNGEHRIRARMFDGDDRVAFVKAVEANIAHGLPLTLRDRRAAAAKIIAAYPEWSDRAVAASTGLAARTISSIRAGLADGTRWRLARIGRDGRARPVDPAEGRQRAAAVIADRPAAPLREVARAANVSLGTARDVRRRLQNGEDPLPLRMRGVANEEQATDGTGVSHRRQTGPRAPIAASGERSAPSSLLSGLRRDPSLRYSDKGRAILRWLDSRVVDPADWSRLADGLPEHCRYTLVELALGCASAWQQLAEELKGRTSGGRPAADGSGGDVNGRERSG